MWMTAQPSEMIPASADEESGDSFSNVRIREREMEKEGTWVHRWLVNQGERDVPVRDWRSCSEKASIVEKHDGGRGTNDGFRCW